jgi:hypothetical protein
MVATPATMAVPSPAANAAIMAARLTMDFGSQFGSPEVAIVPRLIAIYVKWP